MRRWLDGFDDAAIHDVNLAVAALQALGDRHHARAYSTLRDLAEDWGAAAPSDDRYVGVGGGVPSDEGDAASVP